MAEPVEPRDRSAKPVGAEAGTRSAIQASLRKSLIFSKVEGWNLNVVSYRETCRLFAFFTRSEVATR